jgi:hypothetical protein
LIPALERWFDVARVEILSSLRRYAGTVTLPSPLPPFRGLQVLRPIVVMAAVAWILTARHTAPGGADEPSSEAALAKALSERGLVCAAADVAWVSRPRGLWLSMFGKAQALVRAHAADEPSDLYMAEARLSPEGAVLDVSGVWNLTETIGADESRPILRGHLAVYTTVAEGLYTGVHILDLDGREEGTEFTLLQRLQIALTNLQRTGQKRGVTKSTIALDPVAREATLAWRDDGIVELHADDRVVTVDPSQARVLSGGGFVRIILDERARPGNLVTWAVDRVRALPWFGDDRMQWVKAIAFTALDRWHAEFSHSTSAQEVEEELGLPQAAGATPMFVDPEIGWPPPPMKTAIVPPLPGEGQWIALDRDPFITRTAGAAAAAFVTSFVRPSVQRQDVRVYVTLWDPRQIALHVEAGSTEPVGPSGEHGTGLVPRRPEVMKRLVAAFNGGFQPVHGEYGLQTNGFEYLPPKPYAATVVELRDGSNAFGAWPAVGHDADIPSDIVAYRQNLTALVQNGRFNPWGRAWWGGTPPGWPDQIHSTRSAICLTREGFVGYFYSQSIAADDLAQGMLDARCSFGIHLDMNPGHAGFEFYDVVSDGPLKPLGRPLQSDWEAEGKVSDMSGYVFRSRRMIRGMGHMLFPRYIQRESRDFFYLTARPLLPGAPLDKSVASSSDEGIWRTKGLPQNGFPYALATTSLHDRAEGRGDLLYILRADPKALRPAIGEAAQASPVVSLTAGVRGTLSLWWHSAEFTIGASAPAADATALAGGVPLGSPLAAFARAAAGIQDEDGMLMWVERSPSAGGPETETARELDGLLERLGCSSRMLLPGDARALLGGALDLSGAPIPDEAPPAIAARLVRARAPDAHSIFDGTPIVPIQVWQPLQAKRIRYFYKPPAAPSATPSGSPGAFPGGSAPQTR